MATQPTNSTAMEAREAGLRTEIQSPFRLALRRLRKNKGAMIAGIILLLEILMAIAAPLIAPYDPVFIVPKDALQPPSAAHIFGTDQFGRDLFSRVIYGARISLQVGVISVTIATVIGVPLGLVAGFYGGMLDSLIVRAMDLMLAFPGILLALAIISILGPGLRNAMIAVGISAVPSRVRLVRGTVLAARENTYVEAAQAIGCSETTVMFKHILPNVVSPLIVLSTLSVATAILTAAALSYLGLGAQPPIPEWGAMLGGGRNYMRLAWWLTAFPGAGIMVTVMTANILGDGLRDAFDPKLRD